VKKIKNFFSPSKYTETAQQWEYDETIEPMSSGDYDRVRARSMLRVTEPYIPNDNVQATIKECVDSIVSKDEQFDDWRQICLRTNPMLKFKLLTMCEQRLKPADATSSSFAVPNHQLHEIVTVDDVIRYYSQSLLNINPYQQMARDRTNMPGNLHVIETAKRFHPDDTHELHKGVTAFPGEHMPIRNLRDQRLHRSFRARREWFEWQDNAYDATQVPKYAPWSAENIKRMDSVTFADNVEVINFGKPTHAIPPKSDMNTDTF